MKAAVRLPTPLRTLAQSGSLTKSRFAKSPKRASLMSISLYDLSVPTFLQTVNALAGVLDRADEHCAKTGHDPDDFVEVRLIDDMASAMGRSLAPAIAARSGWSRSRRAIV